MALTAVGKADELPLMPLPQSVTQQPGALEIKGDFAISVTGAGASDDRVRDSIARTFGRIRKQTGIPLLPRVEKGDGATLRIVIQQRDHRAPQKLGDDESYSLSVKAGHADLSAKAPLGALRGLETFLQLIHQNVSAPGQPPAAPGFSVTAVDIQDSPRFPWRGLSLDVARHFLTVADVERTLDGMAAVKLNVLHWHLSDDQGFRVESRKFPKLQEAGSEGKYYTQAQIADVIEHARSRGIRVVPEFDMPGHAAAILAAYPMLAAGPETQSVAHDFGILTRLMDPTKESTYKFLDGFVGEMVKLFPDDYFHIGGDEVHPEEWNQNAAIQAFMKEHGIRSAQDLQTYFSRRLAKIVIKHGKRVEGWDEVLQPDLPKTVVIQSWRGQRSLWRAASEGFDGILSAGYYLDLMQPAARHYAVDPMKLPPPHAKDEDDDDEDHQPVPAALTPEQAKHILGGEAAMWEELAVSENLDAKLWPRLAAIAERFWSPEGVTDVDSMYRRLAITNEWLQYLGLQQRSSLVLMRQRLAGSFPPLPLDTFASILEPVRGYERNSEKYKTETPLNRLVDSIPPESTVAREFRVQLDAFLASTADERSRDAARSKALLERLALWQRSAVDVRPMMQANELLTSDLRVADVVAAACQSAQEAIGYLTSGRAADNNWKQGASAQVKAASEHMDNMLIPIAASLQTLINTVPVN